MKPEEDLESPSEITKLMMAISQVKQVTPDDLTNEVKQMSKLHEAPEEIFLQVDQEGDGPGEWDTLDGATWCGERINHNDVRYVRADRVMQLEAENKIDGPCTEGDGCPTEIAVLKREWRHLKAENSTLRGHIEQLRDAVEEGLSAYKVPMTARICEAIATSTDGLEGL